MIEQDYKQLTLFQEDFPASRFPWLESKKEKTMTVTYGRKCSELSESLRRVGSLVRTYLESSALPPGTWSRIWSVKAMTSSCLILKLRLSALRTEETGSHLWPTPRASEYKGCGPVGSKSAEHMNGKHYLSAVVLYATPNARDWKNATATEWDNPKNTRNLNRMIAKMCEGGQSTEERNGQLNPTWVEWLMGFPIGWTELNASEMR